MTETNTTRPTIDEYLAEWFDDDGIEFFKSELADHGYVIVHPDNVPKHHPMEPGVTYDSREQRGWNACRAHIFRETDGSS